MTSTKKTFTPAEIDEQTEKIMFLRRDHGALSVVLMVTVVFYFWKDCLIGVCDLFKTDGYVWADKAELFPWESLSYDEVHKNYKTYMDFVRTDMNESEDGDNKTKIHFLDAIELQNMGMKILFEAYAEQMQERMNLG